MTMSIDLYLAILSMDAYNRGYEPGLVVGGSQVGNANDVAIGDAQVSVAKGDIEAQAAHRTLSASSGA